MRYLVLFFSLIMISCNNSKSADNSLKDFDLVGNYEVISMAEIEDEVIADKNLSINFKADGKVNGNNSCNNYGGDYKVEQNKLSFGMMMSTRRFCQETAEIEATFMQNLTEVDGFKIQEQVLILLRGNTHVIEAKKVSNKDD